MHGTGIKIKYIYINILQYDRMDFIKFVTKNFFLLQLRPGFH
jgi:hypothetical protein